MAARADSANRQSNTLRLSVLETAIGMGIRSDVVQKWMFDPIEEGDERDADETSLTPGLTSASTAASEDSFVSPSHRFAPLPSDNLYNQNTKNYNGQMAPSLARMYDFAGIIIRSETPLGSEPAKDKRNKKNASGNNSDGGYLSDAVGFKSKAKTLAAKDKPGYTGDDAAGYATDTASSHNNNNKEKKTVKKFFGRDGYASDGGSLSTSRTKERKLKKKRSANTDTGSSEEISLGGSVGSLGKTKVISNKDKKLSAEKHLKSGTGYETDDGSGYISEAPSASPSKKSKGFFRRRGSSASRKSADEALNDSNTPPPVPPMPLPLPIALRFARAQTGEESFLESTNGDGGTRSETPMSVATTTTTSVGEGRPSTARSGSSDDYNSPIWTSRALTPRISVADPLNSKDREDKSPVGAGVDIDVGITDNIQITQKAQSAAPIHALKPPTRRPPPPPPPSTPMPSAPLLKTPSLMRMKKDKDQKKSSKSSSSSSSSIASGGGGSPPRRALSTRDISGPNPHLMGSLKPPPSPLDILNVSQNRASPRPSPLPSPAPPMMSEHSDYEFIDPSASVIALGLVGTESGNLSVPPTPSRPRRPLGLRIHPPSILVASSGLSPIRAGIGGLLAAHLNNIPPPSPPPTGPLPNIPALQLQVSVQEPSPITPRSPRSPRRFLSPGFLPGFGRGGNVRDAQVELRARSPSPVRANPIGISTMYSAVNVPSAPPSRAPSPIPGSDYTLGPSGLKRMSIYSRPTSPSNIQRGRHSPFPAQPILNNSAVIANLRSRNSRYGSLEEGDEEGIYEEEFGDGSEEAARLYARSSVRTRKDVRHQAGETYLDLEDKEIEEDDDSSYYPEDDDRTAGRRTVVFSDEESQHFEDKFLTSSRNHDQLRALRRPYARQNYSSSKHSLAVSFATTADSRPTSFIDGERSANLRSRFVSKVGAMYGPGGREREYDEYGYEGEDVPPVPPMPDRLALPPRKSSVNTAPRLGVHAQAYTRR